MYPDPKRIRDNRVVIRLNDYESDLLKALATEQGDQLSTMLREMVMRQAREILAQEPSSTPRQHQYLRRIT
jgi:uncharacterized protein (DUF1778 family)